MDDHTNVFIKVQNCTHRVIVVILAFYNHDKNDSKRVPPFSSIHWLKFGFGYQSEDITGVSFLCLSNNKARKGNSQSMVNVLFSLKLKHCRLKYTHSSLTISMFKMDYCHKYTIHFYLEGVNRREFK